MTHPANDPDEVEDESAPTAMGTDAGLPAGSPRQLGRYRLIRVIGRGGMGTVYAAFDAELKRVVALKVLAPELASTPEMRERFAREARVASRLDHPSIIPIYDVGREDEWDYYAMRLVEGTGLLEHAAHLTRVHQAPDLAPASRLRSVIPFIPPAGRLRQTITFLPGGLESVLAVVEQIARALHYAHRSGVIHRDVNPNNIMVDRDGMAHLLDFGAVKLVNERTDLRDSMVGTVRYMSPEQLVSGGHDIDARTDVYSLGATLYECLAGRGPFSGESQERLIYQIGTTAPPPPHRHNPEITRDLETVTLKCLEKRREDRYPDALTLAEELASLRAHQRIDATAVGVLGKLRRWADMNRALAATTAALIVIVFSIPVLLGYQRIASWRHREGQAAELRSRAALMIAERRALAASLAELREDQLTGQRALPVHVPVADPRKLALLARTREIAVAERRLDELAKQIRFAFDDALGFGVSDDEAIRGERDRFLFTLYVEAERNRDRAAMDETRFLLESSPLIGELEGRGWLTLTTRPEGADVTVLRFREAPDGRLELDREHPVFGGTSPLVEVSLPVGSYVALVSKAGYRELRYPFLVERGEHWGHVGWHDGLFRSASWTVSLIGDQVYDAARWVHVPAGPFLATQDLEYVGLDPPLEWQWLDSFLIARTETTYGEYEPFLTSAEAADEIRFVGRSQKRGLIPRSVLGGGSLPPIRVDFEQKVPISVDPDARSLVLSGISQSDAKSFAVWSSATAGYPHRLPTGREWEKAARGVDGRLHPWGSHFDWSFVSAGAAPYNGVMLPGTAGRAPVDESPYGVQDMAGHVAEWCGDGPDLGEEFVNPWVCGGDLLGLRGAQGFTVWPVKSLAFDNVFPVIGVRLVRQVTRR